jgi:hypothetical protein
MTREYFPEVADRLKMNININQNFTTMVKGHGDIRSYLHRFKIIETPVCPCSTTDQTPVCPCSTTDQTPVCPCSTTDQTPVCPCSTTDQTPVCPCSTTDQTPVCPCSSTDHTIDHMLYECELLNKERDKLISTILKTDVWPISKNKLLTLKLPTTTIVAQPFNVIKWQLKFNPVA